MNQFYKRTPDGTRDLLFEECEARRKVEGSLTKLFKKLGYNEVMTPILEFYDVFARHSAGMPQEMMYKLVDSKGRLMVLRPDCTLPIARLSAARLRDAQMPLRLYYNETVYRINPGMTGRSNEIAQTGVELIGASGIRADLEVIMASIKALTKGGAPDFMIEIGHAGFFTAIAKELPVNDECREDIRSFIELKNFGALGALLDQLPDTPAIRAMRALPRMFGGEEVFEKATELCGDIANEPLTYLKEIYRNLSKLGLNGKIIIDLGLAHRGDYYTGVIFRGYMKGYGDTVLSGGRYDLLLDGFGFPLPATGFGVNVDSLARAMLASGAVEPLAPADVMIHSEDGYEVEALLYIQQLIATGLVCENSVFTATKQAMDSAAANHIKRFDVVGPTIKTIDLSGEENQ